MPVTRPQSVQIDTLVAELLAQQSGEDLLVVAETDLLDLLPVQLQPDRPAVVGHQRRAADLDGSPERHQVIFETPTGVDLLTPVREVRVLTVELRSAAREVLGHRRHRARTEITAQLEALDVRGGHLGHERAVVAEGVELAPPARLGAQVDLRVQAGADPDRQVLLTGDVGELADALGVLQGRQPQRLGPGGHGAGSEGCAAVLGEGVPWVGAHRDGDGVRGAGGKLLQSVGPLSGLTR